MIRTIRISAGMSATLAVTLLCIFATVTSQPVQAQTFNVLHSFTGGQDGKWSESGITLGGSGTLYGTTYAGGMIARNCDAGCGTVFKLTRHNSSWIFSPLYEFTAPSAPTGGITLGPGGVPFGTTTGGNGGNGTVFYVTPESSICHAVQCFWNKGIATTFTGGNGALPQYGNLTFDAAGDIYGTTYGGPYPGGGVMYKLTRSGGSWTPAVLWSFGGGDDGTQPQSNVVIDALGNYDTTTSAGGAAGLGTIVQIAPAHGGYVETVLYNFHDDQNGYMPIAGLIMDAQGNLYGATVYGGSGGGGTIFKLSPVGGQWQFSLLYSFTGGAGPVAGNLTMDASGNLYGATAADGVFDMGMVFKLTPSNGSWRLTDLHDFTNLSDGRGPTTNVALDADGNLYGTASGGGTFGGDCGTNGCGVVWQITP